MYFDKSSFGKKADILVCASCKSGGKTDGPLKTLPCRQVVCEKCLQELVKGADKKGEYKCKLCQQMHPSVVTVDGGGGSGSGSGSKKSEDPFKYAKFLTKTSQEGTSRGSGEKKEPVVKDSDSDSLSNYLPTAKKKSVTSEI